jgi:hypothetical protein
MSNSHDMFEGDVFTCRECGMELKVIRPGRNADMSVEESQCHPSADPCMFTCCGRTLEKKAGLE